MAAKRHWTEIRPCDVRNRVRVSESYGTVCVSFLHEDGWPIAFERFRVDGDGYMSRAEFDKASWFAKGLAIAANVLA